MPRKFDRVEALPCLCGSVDIEIVHRDAMPDKWGYCRCRKCGNTERGAHHDPDSAIEAWNECARRHVAREFDRVELPRIKQQYPLLDAKALIEARGDDEAEEVMDRIREEILPHIGRGKDEKTD